MDLREQARGAVAWIYQGRPLPSGYDLADAASDVWEPVLRETQQSLYEVKNLLSELSSEIFHPTAQISGTKGGLVNWLSEIEPRIQAVLNEKESL